MAQLQERHHFELDEVLAALRARSESDPADLLEGAVRIIAKVEHLPHEQVRGPEAELLASRFALHLDRLLRRLDADPEAVVAEQRGMLGLDAIFADYVAAEFGSPGDGAAAGLAAAARAAWREYESRPGLFTITPLLDRWKENTAGSCVDKLAELVWKVAVEPDEYSLGVGRVDQPQALSGVLPAPNDQSPAEGAASKAQTPPQPEKVPALAHGVLNAIAAAFWRPDRRVRDSDAGIEIVDRHGAQLGRVNIEGLTSEKRVDLLDAFRSTETLTAHRLLRWLVAKVTEQDSTPEARKVTVSGGLEALAGQLGVKGHRVSGLLRNILDLFERIELRLPDGNRPLLSWTLTSAARGTKAKLVITLDHAVLPTYVALMGKSLPQREAKRLVPVPLALPPLVGHPNTHGAQAALQMLLMAEIRAQAGKVSSDGFAVVDQQRWAELFALAGVPMHMNEEVMVRWISTDERRSFLFRSEEDPANAVRLDEAFGAALTLIERSGRREDQGRTMRKRSIKSRLR